MQQYHSSKLQKVACLILLIITIAAASGSLLQLILILTGSLEMKSWLDGVKSAGCFLLFTALSASLIFYTMKSFTYHFVMDDCGIQFFDRKRTQTITWNEIVSMEMKKSLVGTFGLPDSRLTIKDGNSRELDVEFELLSSSKRAKLFKTFKEKLEGRLDFNWETLPSK